MCCKSVMSLSPQKDSEMGMFVNSVCKTECEKVKILHEDFLMIRQERIILD